MKAFAALAVSAALLCPAAFAADQKDIVETAVGAGQFKTLASLLTAADLVDTLKGDGPFTVFAPTDEAFKKVPADTVAALKADKEKLKKVLLAHVVVGKSVKSGDVKKMDGEMVNHFPISTKGGAVKIGEAKVVKADIACKNGVIHVIDTVLVPNE